MSKIFLVGLPGAGKSTLGKELARTLHLDFFDLDTLIEGAQHRSIGQIFKEEGEQAFREIEHNSLVDFTTNHEDFLLATGGGTPCFYDHMEFMNQVGLTVFLDPPRDVIVDRVRKNAERPLLEGQNPTKKISDLYSTRLPFYSKAQLKVDTSDLSLEETLESIKKAAESRFRV